MSCLCLTHVFIYQTKKLNLSITSRSSQLSLESRVASGTSAKSGKKRNDLERCDPLAVPRGDKPTKLSCFNHFTSFYLIFLPNFCSLPRSQPTGEEGKTHQKRTDMTTIVIDMIGNGPRLWTCAGLSLLSTCLALAWGLRWLENGGYEANIEKKQDFLAAK